MKQTAVEWLLENLNSEPYNEEDFKYNSECWDKAKAMEKEQMNISKIDKELLNITFKLVNEIENRNKMQKDEIVESVINEFRLRSERGIKKYGTTLQENELSPLEWLKHLQEELMDAVLYLEKVKQINK